MKPERRRKIGLILLALVAVAFVVHLVPRPEGLSLASAVDGPPLAQAKGVVVFLHGRGGSLWRARSFARDLRAAGLPDDVAIVLLEGPYATPLGYHWGDGPEAQAKTRPRIRARLDELFAGKWPPPNRVVVAGFSQGAGIAIDLAAEDARFGALASFSPCYSALRGELAKRDDLRAVVVHGDRDRVCPPQESQTLARVLREAHKDVNYIQFDGGHAIPQEGLRALVALLTP